MQLSINSWSPFASHLICLFLGLALANITYEPCLQEIISPHKIMLPVLNRKFLKISPKRVYSGQKMMLVKLEKNKTDLLCLETESSGKIRRYNQSFFVEVSKKSGKDYLNLLKDKFYLVPYDFSLMYPLCQSKPEVSYGTY